MAVNSVRPVLLWFRCDLRLADNPALAWAASSGRPLIPVFVLDEEAGDRSMGGASRWWLHGSLGALDAALQRLGSRLILRRGPSAPTIAALVRETGATAIAWNRRYDPALIQGDEQIKAQCEGMGLEVRSFNAALLFEPWAIHTGRGLPYRVFTPFWRQCCQQGFERPLGPPLALPSSSVWPASDALAAWNLRCSSPDWAAGLRATWQPGEQGARQRLDRFADDQVARYHAERDHPGQPGTSMLSPHLHFGEIGPRQVVAALAPEQDAFLRELGWREFSYHLLFYNPEMGTRNLRPEFDRMPWRDDAAALQCWQRGQTGYPLVDAGMRQLWAIGWMHNRVRMLAASFLTKHLLIDWRPGAAWFWDTLVDADWANNSAGWQWTAGCGVDAAPYFRIFNPVAQSQRFDAAGHYLRTWLPELRQVPAKWMHAPWQAPHAVLAAADVRLGDTYPRPMVDHAVARRRALAAYRTLQSAQ